MVHLRRSPQRHSFQKESYLDRKQQEGKTPENDPDVAAMSDYFDDTLAKVIEQESDPEWAKNNLEYDLRTTDWIVNKVQASEVYAQNLYAALCNNYFQKKDTWNILTDRKWSCSWRHAGGIIAHMRESGDYIDWYCSGIRNNYDCGYVSESEVVDEIEQDLNTLGWIVIKDD